MAPKTLSVLNNDACKYLQDSLEDNFEQYKDKKSWFVRWTELKGLHWELPTVLQFSNSVELINKNGDKNYDLENSIRIHKGLPLTRIQAQDTRLWTKLCHVEYWEYMRSRWDIETYGKDKSSQLAYIKSHYFVAQSRSRALIRNGLARLWWSAEITFDDTRDNRYELTGVLFRHLDTLKNLLERNFGRNPHVTRTFLEFMVDNREECMEQGTTSRDLVRHLSKALNLRGGVSVLDCLSTSDITEFLSRERDLFLLSYGT